jgi:hypothetical protein
MLVTVGPVVIPWDVRENSKELDAVSPTSWRFVKEGLTPYEFSHASNPISWDSGVKDFLVDFRAVLEKWSLTDTLGVCTVRPGSMTEPAGMEFTSGRANITLPFDTAPSEGGSIDAMWQFSSAPLTHSSNDEAMLPGNSAVRTSYDNRISANVLVLAIEDDVYSVAFGACKICCKGNPHKTRQIAHWSLAPLMSSDQVASTGQGKSESDPVCIF